MFGFENELVFKPKPNLSHKLFKDGMVSVKLFTSIQLNYFNEDLIDTFDKNASIEKIEVIQSGTTHTFNNRVSGMLAIDIRNQNVDKINIYIKKRKETK